MKYYHDTGSKKGLEANFYEILGRAAWQDHKYLVRHREYFSVDKKVSPGLHYYFRALQEKLRVQNIILRN